MKGLSLGRFRLSALGPQKYIAIVKCFWNVLWDDNSSLYKQFHAILMQKLTYLWKERTTDTCEGEGRTRCCFATAPLERKTLKFSVGSDMSKITLAIPLEIYPGIRLFFELSSFLPLLLLQFLLFQIISVVSSLVSPSSNVCVWFFAPSKVAKRNSRIRRSRWNGHRCPFPQAFCSYFNGRISLGISFECCWPFLLCFCPAFHESFLLLLSSFLGGI